MFCRGMSANVQSIMMIWYMHTGHRFHTDSRWFGGFAVIIH